MKSSQLLSLCTERYNGLMTHRAPSSEVTRMEQTGLSGSRGSLFKPRGFFSASVGVNSLPGGRSIVQNSESVAKKNGEENEKFHLIARSLCVCHELGGGRQQGQHARRSHPPSRNPPWYCHSLMPSATTASSPELQGSRKASGILSRQGRMSLEENVEPAKSWGCHLKGQIRA